MVKNSSNSKEEENYDENLEDYPSSMDSFDNEVVEKIYFEGIDDKIFFQKKIED